MDKIETGKVERGKVEKIDWKNEDYNLLNIEGKNRWIILVVIIAVVFILVISMAVWFFIWAFNKNNLVKSDEQGNNQSEVENKKYISLDIDPNNIDNYSANTMDAAGIDQTANNPCNTMNLTSTGNECTCTFPYFGPYCSREYHESGYVSVGTDSDMQNLSFTSENVTGITSLSYANNNTPTKNTNPSEISVSGQSCTGVCNSDPNCKGVVYNSNGCSIITSDITLKQNFNPTNLFKENPTVFLNNRGKISIMNKVFLYSGRKPFRHWVERGENIPNPQASNSNGFIALNPGIPIQLNWAPEKILNESHLVGIWSTKPINIQSPQVNDTNVYIDKLGYSNTSPINYKLNLPDYIKNSPTIYVTYIPLSSIQNLKSKYIPA